MSLGPKSGASVAMLLLAASVCVWLAGCGVPFIDLIRKPAPREIYLGACGDWRRTVPEGYVVGIADSHADRMTGIQMAVARARERAAASMGSQVYQAVLDSAKVTGASAQRLFRTLSRHVTDQEVSMVYPVAFFGEWKDNAETWSVLARYSPTARRSLMAERGLIERTLRYGSLNLTEQDKRVIQQQLDRVNGSIALLSRPHAAAGDEGVPWDPHNCRQVGTVHLPDIRFEGHPDSDIMWTHPQPSNYAAFLWISAWMSAQESGIAVRIAERDARVALAAFLRASIQQDFVSAYRSAVADGHRLAGGAALEGSLLQEVADEVSHMKFTYVWTETSANSRRARATVLLRFDYESWMMGKLQAEFHRLLVELRAAQAAEVTPEEEAIKRIEEGVRGAEKVIKWFGMTGSGAQAIKSAQ